jgi:hypothetical protein
MDARRQDASAHLYQSAYEADAGKVRLASFDRGQTPIPRRADLFELEGGNVGTCCGTSAKPVTVPARNRDCRFDGAMQTRPGWQSWKKDAGVVLKTT